MQAGAGLARAWGKGGSGLGLARGKRAAARDGMRPGDQGRRGGKGKAMAREDLRGDRARGLQLRTEEGDGAGGRGNSGAGSLGQHGPAGLAGPWPAGSLFLFLELVFFSFKNNKHREGKGFLTKIKKILFDSLKTYPNYKIDWAFFLKEIK